MKGAEQFLAALQRSLEIAFLAGIQVRYVYRNRLVDEPRAIRELERGRAVTVAIYDQAGASIGYMRVSGRS